jgi:neutral ceramidase
MNRFPCVIVILLLSSLLHAADREKPGFRAGAFALDITPKKFPISVNGGLADRLATKVHDPLHARCLVLDDGKTKLAIVICDSCMIPRELLDAAKTQAEKTTGIAASRMLIAATHTHTAPTVTGVFQSEPDREYIAYLTERIAAGIKKAHDNLAPAKIGWAVGKDPTQVYNRRWFFKPGTLGADPFDRDTDKVRMNPGYLNTGLVKPAGPTDPDVSILSVQTAVGKPLALLANYSLHYVGGVEPLSADYFGAFADRIQQLLEVGKTDPPFVGILSNGTSGDVNNINFGAASPGPRNPYEQIRVVSDSVARAAHEAHRTIEHRDTVTLSMAEKEIELSVRLPDEKELLRAQRILYEAKKPVLTGFREVYARETVLLAKYPKTVKVKLQALRIGELGVVAVPCEVFTEIGLEIKKTSPLKPTFTIELANGYNGYLPTPEQHKLGGYETWRARSSYLEVDASTKIVAGLKELLSAVSPKSK